MSNKKNLPIIFFHKSNSWYLKYTLKQARFYHPDAEIYLLGDESNSHYKFVTHINISKYEEITQKFRNLYHHRNNSTLYEYELFCFLRWFYILGFVQENNLEKFIYLDSDVLVFENFENIRSLFDSFSIANTGKTVGMPAFTFFGSQKSIENFCMYMNNSFTDQFLTERLSAWWGRFKADDRIGGICDMTLFDLFFKDYPNNLGKLDKIGLIGFDSSISTFMDYEEKNNIKNIYWKNKKPYFRHLISGELIRFVDIHYQGDSKKFIPSHYQAGGLGISRWKDILKINYFNYLKINFLKIRNYLKQFFM